MKDARAWVRGSIGKKLSHKAVASYKLLVFTRLEFLVLQEYSGIILVVEDQAYVVDETAIQQNGLDRRGDDKCGIFPWVAEGAS